MAAAVVLAAAALVADALENQAVAADAKTMLAGNLFAKPYQFVRLEFCQLAAFDAVEMVVLGVAIVVFVNAATVEFETSQKPCVDEFFERSVDSWAADVVRVPLARQLVDQLVGIEMLVSAKDLFDQKDLLLCLAQSATKQVLFKPLNGRLRDCDGFQWLFV